MGGLLLVDMSLFQASGMICFLISEEKRIERGSDREHFGLYHCSSVCFSFFDCSPSRKNHE